jgi:homopolymeric O-antigen transport system ATP-binding protein
MTRSIDSPARSEGRAALRSGTPIITVRDVSKAFRPQTHQVSLRHEATKMARQIVRRRPLDESERFWALRDVSFDVVAGEGVAVVGRNGSGKTTLLRILAGITRPTTGSAAVHGRFAALIGLGAGFNPERTGRENIFLNAAIHGIPPKRVKEFIGEIIEFAELGDYIDAPVKRYSSGMVARLGFSIAAHIFPDTIFVDEVLAVGDAAFQEKCIERIRALRAEGKTLLFVSHATESLRQVCERAIWLHHGELRMDGPIDPVLAAYDSALHAHTDGTAQGTP